MKLVPLGYNVIIQRKDAAEKTAGGIVLPDTAKEQPQQGKVLSVGDSRMLDNGQRAPMEVNEGERVLFASCSGDRVDVDRDRLLIMSESDILAIAE